MSTYFSKKNCGYNLFMCPGEFYEQSEFAIFNVTNQHDMLH